MMDLASTRKGEYQQKKKILPSFVDGLYTEDYQHIWIWIY